MAKRKKKIEKVGFVFFLIFYLSISFYLLDDLSMNYFSVFRLWWTLNATESWEHLVLLQALLVLSTQQKAQK